MTKEILLIDAEKIDGLNLCFNENYTCPIWNNDMCRCQYNLNTGSEHCPLKDLPSFVTEEEMDDWGETTRYRGYNSCLCEILGIENNEFSL